MSDGDCVDHGPADDPPVLDRAVDRRLDVAGGDPRYEFLARLGSGGGGEVLLVHDRHLRRDVALKALRAAHASQPARVHSFVREARVTAGLEHPSILPVFDLDVAADGRPYFMMRRASGRSLAEIIRAAASGAAEMPPLADRVEIMVKVCEAIAYAHSRGIVHQDIKPANILLGDYGEVLLCDWGTAFASGDSAGGSGRRLVGTPAYMSPEQARREPADVRSDVYCLGATLYQMLTLRLPTVSADVEEFWDKKRRGVIDPLSDDVRARLPVYLLTVALRALAADPSERYQDVPALVQDLRGYQRNQESLGIAERAERRLAAVGADGSYEEYASVREQFHTALSLWGGNAVAAAGLRRASVSYAWAAIARGDIELAASLSPDDDADLGRALATARQKRRRERSRTRRLRMLALLLGLMVCGAGAWIAQAYLARFATWHVVADYDFMAGAAADGLEMTWRRIHEPEALPEPRDGALRLPEERILWLPQRISGDVRLTVDVTWPDRAEFLALLLHARRAEARVFWHLPISYVGVFGSWGGSANGIALNRETMWPSMSHVVLDGDALRPGRRYRLTFGLDDGWLSIAIDGVERFRRQVLLPLAAGDDVRIALRPATPVLLHRIVVERQTLPLHSTPLLAGDAWLSGGEIEKAEGEYLRIADDHAGTEVGEEALARACVAASLAADDASGRAAAHLERLRTAYAGGRFLHPCIEAVSLARWQDGSIDASLDLLDEAVAADAGSRLAVTLAEQPPGAALDEVQQRRFLVAISRTPGLVHLDLQKLGLRSLAPLAGLRLTRLRLNDNRIDDLSPLAGMPLTSLEIARNRVADLAPLRGTPLQHLDVSDNAVADLSPLEELPLTYLLLDGNRIDDLRPLRNLPLDQLVVARNPLTDISPLASMSRLRGLNISNTKVSDIEPLRGLVLRSFACSGAPVVDLAPLADAADPWYLTCARTRVRSLAALDGMSRLEVLDAAGNDLADIDAIAALERLTSLDLSGCGLTSLPDIDLPRLRTLRIDGNHLRSLPRLGTPALERLDAHGNPLTDVAALRGMTLDHLDIAGHRMPTLDALRDVRITGTCRVGGASVANGAIAALAAQWRADGASAAALRALEVQEAVASGDPERVRALATRIGDSVYLATWEMLGAAEAAAFAQRMGARLPILRDAATQQAVLALADRRLRYCWLGLRTHADGERWDDGSAPAWNSFGERHPPASDGMRWTVQIDFRQGSWWPGPPAWYGEVGPEAAVVLEWPLPWPSVEPLRP